MLHESARIGMHVKHHPVTTATAGLLQEIQRWQKFKGDILYENCQLAVTACK